MGVGTASSAATMPVTMKNAEDHGCAPGIVQFVIPLGTNINRDGAALYEAVTVIFILQVLSKFSSCLSANPHSKVSNVSELLVIVSTCHPELTNTQPEIVQLFRFEIS